MTWKSVKLLIHLVIVYFYSHILTAYVIGIRLIFWSITLVKLGLFPSPRKLTYQLPIVLEILLYCSDCRRDLGVLIDCKLYFHLHVDFFFTGNETAKVNSYVPFPPYTAYWCYILFCSCLSLSMYLLHGTPLWLQTPKNLITYKVQPFATIRCFFKQLSIIMII
jgi:hypothetical protein